MSSKRPNYIHGFSPREQARLIAQARVLAPSVFDGLDLAGTTSLLELGCGVGAELELIHARWPDIHLTGIDLSERHLRAAARHLREKTNAGAIDLALADGYRLPFRDASFAKIITIWVLEHLDDPERLIAEALRVLVPGGELICTEVDNKEFGFAPAQPAITAWWDSFNRYQAEHGGHPYVGGELAGITRAAGFDCSLHPLDIIASRDNPRRRTIWLDYLRDLLLSGADNMLAEGYADENQKQAMSAAFDAVKSDPGVEFWYRGVRLRCQKRST